MTVAASQPVRIAVSRRGYFVPASAAPVLTLSPGETAVRDFELRPLLKISGVVEDGAGSPIAGAHVFALRRTYDQRRTRHTPAGIPTADTRTGIFEIRNLEPGDYVLEIMPENPLPIVRADSSFAPSGKFSGWCFYPDASRIEMAVTVTVSEADVPLTIRMFERESHGISGTVAGAATLELVRPVDGDSRLVASGRLAAAGPFRIDNVPDGDYRLIARTSDGKTDEAPVTVEHGDVANIRLTPQSAKRP